MEDKYIEKYFDKKKMPLQDIIRLFKREGIENFVIVKREKFENVLEELERLDKSDTSKEKSSMDYYNKYKEIKSDLETWKKIAEVLTLRIVELDDTPFAYCRVKENENCDDLSCIDCVIDWAKNEVLKNE